MHFFLQDGYAANQRFKIPVVVVVADEQQTERAFGRSKSFLHVLRQRRLLAEEGVVIKTVVDADHILPRPAPQVAGKGFAGGDRAVRRAHGPSGKRGLDRSIEPQTIVAAVPQITQKVGRGVECVPAEKDLRHGRAEERKVSRRQQDVGAGPANQIRKVALLVEQPFRGTGGTVNAQKSNARRFCDFVAQLPSGEQGCAHVVPNRKARQHVANVGEPPSSTGRERVDEKVNHLSWRFPASGATKKSANICILRDAQHLAQASPSSAPPRIYESRVKKTIFGGRVFHFDLPTPQQGRAVQSAIDGAGAGREAETMVALNYFPGVRIHRIPAECPGEGVDRLLRPGGELARAVANLPPQFGGRESYEPLMRERMVADCVASRCEFLDLTGIHWLPVLPFLVAGFGVGINPLAIEGEGFAGSTLRKGGHDKEDTSSSERLKQARCDSVVALSPVIKSE